MLRLGEAERMENLLSQDDLNSLFGDISFEASKEPAPAPPKEEMASEGDSLSQDEIDKLLDLYQK